MKLEEFISLISSVPFLAFFLYTLLYTVCAADILNPVGLINYFLGILLLSVMPVLPILIYTKKGRVDIYVTDKEKRTIFFAWAVLVYFLSTGYFYLVELYAISLFSLCYATVTFSLLLANYYTKISVHVAGLAGPLTYIVYALGPLWSLGYVFVIPIAWARYKMNAHNLTQLALGFIVSVSVTLATINFALSYFPLLCV